MKPCIVIPVFNHETLLPATLAKVLTYELPVILVNDGSGPACSQVMQALADEHAQVHLVCLAQNRGKGGAVKAGLQAALAMGYSHGLQVDADGQHNLEDIPRFLAAAARTPAALICGVPEYDTSVPTLRHYARYLTHVWVWINTLSLGIKDSMCGFRVYPLAPVCALLANAYTGNRMDFDPEVLVRWFWAGGDLVNLPTAVHYPEQGVSHFLPGLDNWLISCMHTRLFFGMLWRAPLWLLGLARRGRCL
ncbi:glycosyltransferase family 2 protein [Simiduia sp. 21SJ11W-1]|uniref:glycosyltransferase family 2 protein n=1 Tax=Simiduia sp. 21SJ11W-1 TaxID=2909669 RepID=UPI0020A10DFF|nr:glycosyltransferase family 2 protein [Simiduia sp. 21SJ11W-1]UTA48720.1 glycosyltransferase family 2 protein [Simiduia sp. 21SJ11W-1]